MCQRLEHGKFIYKHLSMLEDTPVWWLSGSDSSDKRGETIEQFRANETGAILIVSKIFDAGVDIPEIDVLGLMGGGESTNTTLQRIGRALRPNRDVVTIYDGLDGRQRTKDYLAKHSLQRLSDYASKGYHVELPTDVEEYDALVAYVHKSL